MSHKDMWTQIGNGMQAALSQKDIEWNLPTFCGKDNYEFIKLGLFAFRIDLYTDFV